MNRFFSTICLGLIFLNTYALSAQNQIKTYAEDPNDVINPERGFTGGMTIGPNAPKPNTVSDLRKFRTLQAPFETANFKIQISLLHFNVILDGFQQKKLSEQFLNEFDRNLAMVREAGVKVVIRFSYNFTPTGNNEPPFRDAPLPIVLEHIKQLTPFLNKNADVIAVAQLGFIGLWGEGGYTDYYGETNSLTEQNIKDRAKILYAFLMAVPQNRMVQVRVPTTRQQFFDIYKSETLLKRIGFHNDAFLSSIDDLGTFKSYDVQKQKRALNTPDVLKKYTREVSTKTVIGGESSAFYDPKYSNCISGGGQAQKQLTDYGYTFLSSTWFPNVLNNWAPCIEEIKKKLGYRFVLKQVEIPNELKRNSLMAVKIHMTNDGYAALFNPRRAYVLLENTKSGKKYKYLLKADPTKWTPGAINIAESIKIGNDIPVGKYKVYLSLPDSSPSISNRSEYAIRFANLNTWDNNTGLNNLNLTISIT